jgi:hypothetical protein
MAQLIYRVTGCRSGERVFSDVPQDGRKRRSRFVVTTTLENAGGLRADSATVHCGQRYPSTSRAAVLPSDAVA